MLNNGKKLFSTLAAATLTSAMLLSAPLQAAEEGKLLIWYSVEGAKGLQKVADEFSKETGVEVKVEAPEDGPGKFQQTAAVGKGPDIWIWAHDRIGEWVAGGLLEPISPSKEMQSTIDPLGWKAFTIDGKVWGYPYAIEAVSLVYNKALVDTPPTSFKEVMELDKKLAKDGKKAILWDYTNTYFTFPLMAANGGYAFKRDTEGNYNAQDTGVNNEGAVKGATLLNTLLREGYMPEGSGYAEMEGGMAQGNVAMMINGPWSWDNLRKANIDFGVAKIPSVDGKASRPFVGVKGVMINKASPNKELAIEFIENYMLQVKGLKTINEAEPIGVPANSAYFEELKVDPNIAATMASAQDGVPMPNNPEMGRFWSAMVSALGNIMDARQSPQEAMDAAAKRILAK